MADIDTIKLTQDGITTTYYIRDTEARSIMEAMGTTADPDTEIALLRAGFTDKNGVYPNAFAAIKDALPRWKVCE